MPAALDKDYETQCDTGTWQLMYWWPDRTWRWARVSRLAFGRFVAPRNPEAALDNSVPLLNFNSQLKASSRALLASLAGAGPSTYRELAARLGKLPETVSEQCKRMVDMGHMRVVGYRYEVSSGGLNLRVPIYGLPEHPDAPPCAEPARRRTRRGGYRKAAADAMRDARIAAGQATDDRIADHLRANGPATLARLSDALCLHVVYIGERLRRNPALFRRAGAVGRAALWEVI